MNPSTRALLWCTWSRRISPSATSLKVRTRRQEGEDFIGSGQREKRALTFVEGLVFEGEVGAFGAPGPLSRWVTISTFDQPMLCAVDDPLDLHFMSVVVASKCITAGSLCYIETNVRHPIVRLQRAKEFRNIRDTHLGATETSLRTMFDLLQDAVRYREDYAQLAAGEMLSMLRSAVPGVGAGGDWEQRIHSALGAIPGENIIDALLDAPMLDAGAACQDGR